MLYIESKSDKRIRQTASATVLILAISAGVLSYNALRELAVQAGIPPMLAFLFPITLDGLILAGSLLILYFAVRGKRSGYGLFLTALGVIASIAGNVVISPENLTYQILHATSPVVLFLSLESLMILLRARSRNAIEAQEELNNKAETVSIAKPVENNQEIAVSPSKPLETQGVTVAHHEATRSTETHTVAIQGNQTVLAEHTVATQVPMSEKAEHTWRTPATALTETKNVGVEFEQKIEKVEQPLNLIPALQTELSKEAIEKAIEIIPPTNIEAPNVAKQVAPKEAKASTPVAQSGGNNQPSKRELVKDLLSKDITMTNSEIIAIIGGERSYMGKVIRAERTKLQEA